MTVVFWVFGESGVGGFVVMIWKGCHSNSRHGNTYFVTNFCWFKSFGIAYGICHCLEFGVTKYSWPFSMCFPCYRFAAQDKSQQDSASCLVVVPVCSHAPLSCHCRSILPLHSKSQGNTYFNKFLRSCCFIFIVLFLFNCISYILPFPIFPSTSLYLLPMLLWLYSLTLLPSPASTPKDLHTLGHQDYTGLRGSPPRDAQ